MILTSQLSAQADEQARQLIANHATQYKTDPSYMANMLAGREHVADSYLSVIREAWHAMTPDARRDPDKRELRREFILQVVQAHLNNRDTVRHFRF